MNTHITQRSVEAANVLLPAINKKGADPVRDKKALREEPKLTDLATDYLEQHAINKREKSVHEDKRMLNKIILPKLGALRVSAVSKRHVRSLHNSLRKTPYQANRVLALLVFPFSRQWASELFHCACEKAGIELQPRQGVHSLRHSLGHAMLDAGAPLPVVQKSLRHRSLSSTSVYLEADAACVDVWRSKAIMGRVAEPPALSLAQIQAEIGRLSKLAASMQAEGDAEGAHEDGRRHITGS